MVQRRYRTRTEIYSIDGNLEFDLRTIKGRKRIGFEPKISAQPAWMEICERLILTKKGNTQFQIGVRFPYSRCKETSTPEFADLMKKSFVSVMPIVKYFS